MNGHGRGTLPKWIYKVHKPVIPPMAMLNVAGTGTIYWNNTNGNPCNIPSTASNANPIDTVLIKTW